MWVGSSLNHLCAPANEEQSDTFVGTALLTVVKEAEYLRVQELVKRIENHPHREALDADLQQNNIYNPFSKNSKAMIRILGNVELFELCETLPKVQSSRCLLYWNQGIVYCTFGQCLIDSESRRKSNKLRLDALSIPNYVIKKGPTHGVRHGKTEVQRVPSGMRGRDAVRKSTLKLNILQVFTIDFSEIQFIVNHNSQSDGQKKSAKRWTNLQKNNHTYHLTPEEKKRYQGQWYLTLNRAGKNGPMKVRSDFRAAGEQVEERLHPDEQRRWHSSSSTSWWDKFEWHCKWAHKILFNCTFFLFQLVSFTVDSDPL